MDIANEIYRTYQDTPSGQERLDMSTGIEYRVYRSNLISLDIEGDLNGLARRGWRVVSSIVRNDDFLFIIMERQKRESHD